MSFSRLFQSTHLHEVWRFIPRDINGNVVVSIHTPTWGVTRPLSAHTSSLRVSIHTPTWGVTLNGLLAYDMLKVSIHTPTWGVTKRLPIHHAFRLFQSTHLHEVWLKFLLENVKMSKFQSTHLHEVWHRYTDSKTRNRCFNPHTYMRCDRAYSVHSSE